MRYWLSSEKMTIEVETNNGKIIKAAPIARRFIGQQLNNLINWMLKQNGFNLVRLEDKDGHI